MPNGTRRTSVLETEENRNRRGRNKPKNTNETGNAVADAITIPTSKNIEMDNGGNVSSNNDKSTATSNVDKSISMNGKTPKQQQQLQQQQQQQQQQ